MTVRLFVMAGVFVIAFMKGAFGGGFAIIGIPFLSMVMDPLSAGALLAPLFVAMDLMALRYWKPSTWSRIDIAPLIPAMIGGIVLGYLALRLMEPRLVSFAVSLITLGFTALWAFGGRRVAKRVRSTKSAIVAGAGAGLTSMMAHSGGPPLAMYLLPLEMPKDIYAGTTSIVFTVGNAVKAAPWIALAGSGDPVWSLLPSALLMAPIGIWAGWKAHERLSQTQLYRACYALLFVTALKLLWDSLFG